MEQFIWEIDIEPYYTQFHEKKEQSLLKEIEKNCEKIRTLLKENNHDLDHLNQILRRERRCMEMLLTLDCDSNEVQDKQDKTALYTQGTHCLNEKIKWLFLLAIQWTENVEQCLSMS